MHIPPNPPPPPPLPPNNPQSGSAPSEPGSNLPLRWGKPRSFWVILGLSIITCSIYYIVYHFMVANELRKTFRWGEDESFKPVTYMWIYGALVLFSILMMSALAGTLVYTGFEFGADKLLDLAEGPLERFTIYLELVLSLAGFYVTFYFLNLNNNAATKVGLPAKGATHAIIVYGFVTGLAILFSFAESFDSMQGGIFGDFDSSRADLLKELALSGMVFMLGLLWLGVAIYFLWVQTELVNYIWERGRFANPPGYQAQYQYQVGAQTAQPVPPAQQAPPIQPQAPPPAPEPPPPQPPTPPSAPESDDRFRPPPDQPPDREGS